MFSERVAYVIALTDIRCSPGGDKLSYATAQKRAELLIMPDPKVQTTNMMTSLYHQGGQREFPRNTLEGVAKSVSKCHDVNHGIIRSQDEMRREFNLKLRNAAILVILGWGPGIAAFVYALLR